MSAPLSLAQALRLTKEQSRNVRPRLELFSHYGLAQFRIFLEAYLTTYGLPTEIGAEEYGGLFKQLHSQAPTGSGTLVVLDSDELLVSRSLRFSGEYSVPDRKTFEAGLQELIAAIESFSRRSSGPVYLLPLDLTDALLTPFPRSFFSEAEARWAIALSRLSALPVVLLKLQRPEVDRTRFFETGEPLFSEGARQVGEAVAEAIHAHATGFLPGAEPKKLLVTDLDNTFWRGLVGEDGWDGLEFGDTDAGKKFWVYQRFLKLLAEEGVLLAIASKNSKEIVEEAFEKLSFFCPRDRFVAIEAHWQPKSQSVRRLGESLQILPKSTVFIDDNPAELEEVRGALPEVTCLDLPRTFAEMPAFLETVRKLFLRGRAASDVENRLKSYQTVQVISALAEQGHEAFEAYLASLRMTLKIETVRPEHKARVLELLNKTNQFNLTGKRYQLSELEQCLDHGAYALSLEDKFCDYGIVGCVFIDDKKRLSQFVLSCRVFSRRIEDEILTRLNVRELKLARTSKNSRVFDFLSRAFPALRTSELTETVQTLKLPEESHLQAFVGIVESPFSATMAT